MLAINAKSQVYDFVMQVGCVTRLVAQKGVHLIRHSIYRTLEKGGQFVLLGSSQIPHIQVCLLTKQLHISGLS